MKKLSEHLNELATKVADVEKKVAAAEQERSEKVEARVKAAKADMKARRDDFLATVNEGQVAVALHWKELQANYDSKLAQIKSHIEAKKDAREQKRAMRRADDAEMYAAAAIDFAVVALAEVEVAVLEAIEARTHAKLLA